MDKATIGGICGAILTGVILGAAAALTTPPEESHAAVAARVSVVEEEVEAFMVPEGHVGPIVATEADGSVF